MGTLEKNVAGDISQQINDALSRLQSKQLFQTTWDIVAFVIFFTFIGRWREARKSLGGKLLCFWGCSFGWTRMVQTGWGSQRKDGTFPEV